MTGASVLAGLAVASCVGGLAQLGARRVPRTRPPSDCACGAPPGGCRCAVTRSQEAGDSQAGGPTPLRARLGARASLLARAGALAGGRLGRLGSGPRAVDSASRLQAAGFDPGELPQLAAIRGGAALAGLGLAAVLAPSLPLRWMLLTALAAPAAGWLAPEVWLHRRARARARAIEAELADVLDLLRVTTAAGLPFQRSLSEVGRRHPGVLAGELGRAAAQLQLGEPDGAVLDALERRCPAAGMPALTAALARSRRFGAPLGGTLAAQAEQARARRAQQCAEAAARASPKIQLVVALLLVPSVLLLVAAALIPVVVEH